MGYLYPRLLPAKAQRLHSELVNVPTNELTGHHALDHVATVYAATGGDRVERQILSGLREELTAAARAAGFPEPPSAADRMAFDAQIGPMLHRLMGILPVEAAVGDIWAFTSLVLAPDVAYWRFRRPDATFDSDRVLRTDLTRHVFARLWWRAYLLYEDVPGADPYGLFDSVGEAAFDQILARRAALGASPTLVKAIVRAWKKSTADDTTDRELLRDFLKRLLRLAPFIAFDALQDDQLEAELAFVITESVEALGR
ncbi:DUF6339 family protein [Dactylosporangium sp. NPDC049140]|uniref:DUF6339 family protein n=1 Tax=Dactylosporangium sp. NPDC049140 TaxID=3155647 RepID=UPI0033DBE383